MDNKIFEGLPTPAIEYIGSLENQLQTMQNRIDQLTEMLRIMQKARFGQSSEKSRYIFGAEAGYRFGKRARLRYL
jgi:TolA-binding protein